MKKRAIIPFVCLVFAIVCLAVVGCTPAKLEKIVGTYKLITDTTTPYGKETVNNIEKYEKEEYLVVTGEEYGYYVYKAKDVPIYCREVKIEYVKNDEGKITSVSYTVGIGDRGRSLLVDANKEMQLRYRWSTATKLIDAYETVFQRVDNATDTSYLKKLYPDLPVYPYETYTYDALFSAEIEAPYADYSDYIYYYYDLDVPNAKATVYYALKSDKKPVVKKNVPLSFNRNKENNIPSEIVVGDKVFLLSGLPNREITIDVQGVSTAAKEQLDNSSHLGLKETDYDDYFKGLITEYEKKQSAVSDENQTVE